MSKTLFQRQVQPGRLVLINYGENEGKTASIVDMIDLRRVVIDGPETGVKRQVIPLKWVNLTDFRCVVARGVREKFLKKQNKEADIHKKWAATAWAQKIERRRIRKNLTDLERFRVLVARKDKSKVVKAAVKKHNIKNKKK